MSDQNNPFPFWNTDWLEAQRKYMEAWSALSGNSSQHQGKSDSGSGNSADNPWNKALEYWWRSIADNAPGNAKGFYEKLIDETQSFYYVTDQLSRFMHGLAEINRSSEEWQKQLDQCFEDMKNHMMSSQGNMGQVLNGMFGAWQLPMDTLQRTMSFGSMSPGDFLQGVKPEMDQVGQVTDKFLSVPGVGYTRESQEQMQEGMRLLANYQRTAHEYHVEISKVGLSALDIMKQRIMEMAENGEEMTTLREVYDLWVDCNEKAYADFVFSDEYSKIYGKLVNDLMALKQHGQLFMDETMSALGMPTRRGMNTMQKRQQEMRRELQASRSRIEKLESELEKIEHLEREVKALKGSNRSTASSSPGSGAAADDSSTSSGVASSRTKKKAKKKATTNKKAKKKTTSKKKTK